MGCCIGVTHHLLFSPLSPLSPLQATRADRSKQRSPRSRETLWPCLPPHLRSSSLIRQVRDEGRQSSELAACANIYHRAAALTLCTSSTCFPIPPCSRAVLHDRYVDPGLAYQGDIDLRVGNAGGAAGRAIYMQQAPPPPQQARVGPHHHLMPAPAPPGTIYSGAGGPMYLAAHPGEAAYPAPPPPQAGVGQGPRVRASS